MIALSGIAAISPSPKVGVGIRARRLPLELAAAKSGCAREQPGASERPLMVNRSWTPPSGVPSGLLTKRASRTGPLALMNGWANGVPPRNVNWRFLGLQAELFAQPAAASCATATCGFVIGLVPPGAGCAWQPAH